MLMAEDMTGFSDQCKQQIHDDMRHPDIEIRTNAEEDFTHFARTFLGPDPSEQSDVRNLYYSEGAAINTRAYEDMWRFVWHGWRLCAA